MKCDEKETALTPRLLSLYLPLSLVIAENKNLFETEQKSLTDLFSFLIIHHACYNASQGSTQFLGFVKHSDELGVLFILSHNTIFHGIDPIVKHLVIVGPHLCPCFSTEHAQFRLCIESMWNFPVIAQFVLMSFACGFGRTQTQWLARCTRHFGVFLLSSNYVDLTMTTIIMNNLKWKKTLFSLL